MMIADAIRNAESDHEIYLLLADYIETAQFAAQLPEAHADLPIISLDDVRTRFRQLIIGIDNASARLKDDACPAIREALQVYGMALGRLRLLDEEKYHSSGRQVLHGRTLRITSEHVRGFM